MNIKRNLIGLAVLSTLGLAGTANAVYLGQEGTGQVLLKPYYTVRGGYDTVLTITNSDEVNGKVVKVRVIEGKNSREVLDFNLYLSPADVWTGTLTATTDGGKLVTTDTSCTVPAIAANQGGAGFAEFRNYYYSGVNADGEATNLNRAREGYIEVIQMGDLTSANGNTIPKVSASTDPTLYAAAKHIGGKPLDCPAIVNAWGSAGVFTAGAPNIWVSAPTGGLFGTGTLINVAGGTDYTYDDVALEQWIDVADHKAPGGILPNLAEVAPKHSIVFYGTGAVASNWTTNGYNMDPVSAVLMRTSVMNDFVTDPGLAAGTDWVVTFPTKNAYVSPDIDSDPDSADNNYLRPFTQDFKLGGACEEVGMQVYGREEEHSSTGVDFSPPPPSGINTICWETNVLTFNSSNVLASELSYNVDTTGVGANGWMRLGFDNVQTDTARDVDQNLDATRQMVSDESITYVGLPVIGFGVQKYVNGNMGGVLSNYGGNFVHKYQRSILGNLIM